MIETRRKYPLPNGIVLLRWASIDGQEWACIAYDHGPFCRRCQAVDATAIACLENVVDGLFEIVGQDDGGDFILRLTDKGNRRAERLIGGENV